MSKQSTPPPIGQRVKHNKPGSKRRGWTGVIVETNERRFTVAYDNGEVQGYMNEAYYRGDCKYPGYIVPLSDVAAAPQPPTPLPRKEARAGRRLAYLVVPERADLIREAHTLIEANETATRCATGSKSGQYYIVYKAVGMFKRATPPVEYVPIETGEVPNE